MPEANNVVLFPIITAIDEDGEEVPSPPQSLEEMHERIRQVRLVHVDDVISSISISLIRQITAAGFDPANEEFELQAGFMFESLRAYLCKFVGVEHEFHALADVLMERQEDGSIDITPNDFAILVTDENENKEDNVEELPASA